MKLLPITAFALAFTSQAIAASAGGGARLPTGCASGQITQWDGSAWVCANLPPPVPAGAALRVYDADNKLVGAWAGRTFMAYNATNSNAITYYGRGVVVLNPPDTLPFGMLSDNRPDATGAPPVLRPMDNAGNGVFFTGTGCTGTPYLAWDDRSMPQPGMVISPNGQRELYGPKLGGTTVNELNPNRDPSSPILSGYSDNWGCRDYSQFSTLVMGRGIEAMQVSANLDMEYRAPFRLGY